MRQRAAGCRDVKKSEMCYGGPIIAGMDSASEIAASISFGSFRVSPQRRELLASGRQIKLGRRAFDVLMALIEARGAVVTKDALMARVWPDRVVEDNNLQVHIVARNRGHSR